MTEGRKAHLVAIAALCLGLAACKSNDKVSKPAIPKGVGYSQSVPNPDLPAGEVAVVDGDIPTTNDKHNTIAYNPNDNPILQILKGFNDIWFAGDTTWAEDGSSNLTAVNGDAGIVGGATHDTAEAIVHDFTHATIRNASIWKENFDYVSTLTRPGQTAPDVDRTLATSQRLAYLDDQRNKAYSIISGLGGLADDYKTGAAATSPYSVDSNNDTNVLIDDGSTTKSIDVTDGSKLYNSHLVAAGTGYGTTTSSLSDVVTLLNTIAAYGASTEAPKYHFQSPRPWRLSKTDYKVPTFSSLSDLEMRTCFGLDGTSVHKYYETPAAPVVKPITGLLCAAKAVYDKTTNSTSGTVTYSSDYDGTGSGTWFSSRGKDGAFPSGHTAEAFDRGLGYAYAIPERFSEMVARAADLGEDRIVAGMHSPLDVIGGRIMATAITAATLYDSGNATIAENAVTQAHDYFKKIAINAGYDSISAYAKRAGVTDNYSDHAAFKARYTAYLTYGFTQDKSKAGQAPVVPKGAEVLLQTRQPYLSAAQRRAVLATTEVDSGYPLLDQSHGWGRLNLVAAADGYGAFNGDVDVYMDATKADINPFYGADTWRNDISGVGRLFKEGTGSLALAGHNSYTGGTLLKGGTLEAKSTTAYGNGDLYQQGGTVEINSTGAVQVKDYTQDGGTLLLDMDNDSSQVSVSKTAYLGGGALQLDFSNYKPAKGAQLVLIKAGQIAGTFDKISVSGGVSITLRYNKQSVVATVH